MIVYTCTRILLDIRNSFCTILCIEMKQLLVSIFLVHRFCCTTVPISDTDILITQDMTVLGRCSVYLGCLFTPSAPWKWPPLEWDSSGVHPRCATTGGIGATNNEGWRSSRWAAAAPVCDQGFPRSKGPYGSVSQPASHSVLWDSPCQNVVGE